MTWKVVNGANVLVGVDPVIGNEENYLLPPPLLYYLAELGFFSLTHIKRPSISLTWLADKDLGLGGVWEKDWNDYIDRLNKGGLILYDKDDELIFACNQSTAQVTAKFSFYALILNASFDLPKWWY